MLCRIRSRLAIDAFFGVCPLLLLAAPSHAAPLVTHVVLAGLCPGLPLLLLLPWPRLPSHGCRLLPTTLPWPPRFAPAPATPLHRLATARGHPRAGARLVSCFCIAVTCPRRIC